MCPSGVVLWMGTFCVLCDCYSCECKCVRMMYIFVCVCSDWSELQNASILQAEGHTHNLSLCLAVLAFTMHLDSCSVSTLLNTQRFKSLLIKTLVFLFTMHSKRKWAWRLSKKYNSGDGTQKWHVGCCVRFALRCGGGRNG
jgi:hypothetical protein